MNRKPDWRDIIKAVDAANKAPIAGNISTLRFVLVQDKGKIKELADACQQDFIFQVHYVVVVCSDNEQVTRSYDERGNKYASEQAGAAIENFLLKLVELKLSSCWVGAFADKMIKNILSIPEEIDVVALLPVGYEKGLARRRRKTNLDNVLFYDEWENEHMKPLNEPPVSRA